MHYSSKASSSKSLIAHFYIWQYSLDAKTIWTPGRVKTMVVQETYPYLAGDEVFEWR